MCVKQNGNVIEIVRNEKYNLKDSELISLILGLENNTVIYNPVNNEKYDVKYYNKLIKNIDGLYKDLEFVCVPEIKNNKFRHTSIITKKRRVFNPPFFTTF